MAFEPSPSPRGADDPAKRKMRRALVAGVVAVFVGLWLLLDAAGVDLPSLGRVWPIFLVFGGLVSLVDYFALSRRASSMGKAVLGVGLGVACFPLALGKVEGWRGVLDWLPSIPLVVGLALVATWAASGFRRNRMLVSGLLLAAFGLLGLAARYDVFERILPSAQVVWAVLLLAAGALLVWSNLRQR